MRRSTWLNDTKRFAWRAAKVIYWSTAAVMIATGASVILGLVACFVFPFLPLLLFFPLVSALGGAGFGTRGFSPPMAGRSARPPATRPSSLLGAAPARG